MLANGHNRFLLLGATSALEALQIKDAGLNGVYLSGAALSASLGFLDEGRLTLEDVASAAKNITLACDLPLIVDCDTGLSEEGVNPKNNIEEYDAIEKMVRAMEKAGAKAIQIEDQVPAKKRCGHLFGKELISMEKMFWKIRYTYLKRNGKNLKIIARTDARAVEGLEGAMWRAKFYIKAGADAIFPEALESAEEFRLFRKEISHIPLVANLAELGKTPSFIKANDLFAMGYQIVLIPATPLRIMQEKFREIAREAKWRGSLKRYTDVGEIIPRDELNEFIKKNSRHYKALAN